MTVLKSYIERTTPIILAGGQGKRLKPVTGDLPKVLAPVCGRPFVFHLFDQLMSAGFPKVVLSTGYRGEEVETACREYKGSIRTEFSREDVPMGTGGGVKLALSMVETDVVMVMNGDSYVDTDLSAFLRWFYERDRYMACMLTQKKDTARYGRIEMDDNGKINRFMEKDGQAGAGVVNAGIYMATKNALEIIPDHRFVSLERDIFPAILAKGLFGFVVADRFIDMGTPESYMNAESFLKTCRPLTLPGS